MNFGKAVDVLLGLPVRTVQTYDDSGSVIYIAKSVPAKYRIPTAVKVLQGNIEIDWLAGLYAMQVLMSEDSRREQIRRK